MSISRCKHCDNQYDQDTDVEHEEICAEEKYGCPVCHKKMSRLEVMRQTKLNHRNLCKPCEILQQIRDKGWEFRPQHT